MFNVIMKILKRINTDVNHFFEIKNYINDVILLGVVITIGYETTLCWAFLFTRIYDQCSKRDENNHGWKPDNQIGGGHLEQVGEESGGIFGGGENQSPYLESSSVLPFQYTVKH